MNSISRASPSIFFVQSRLGQSKENKSYSCCIDGTPRVIGLQGLRNRLLSALTLWKIDLFVDDAKMVQHFDVDADHRKFALDTGRTASDMCWVSLKIALNHRMINLDQTVVCVDSHKRSDII